jgi:anti-sigma-K factor RskA
MSIPDIHTFTGAYAVDALTEHERREFEHHLPDCEPCTTESRSLQAAAVTLAALVPVTASPSLRDRVLAEARLTPQARPLTVVERTTRSHWSGNRLWRSVAAAAVLVAAGLGALAVDADQRADQAERRVAELTSSAPQLQIVSEATRSGGTATLVDTGRSAVFAAGGLPAPTGDRTYQLWVVSPTGATESVGLLALDTRGRLEQVVRDLAPGEVIALTIEPAGGSERPTMMPLVTLAAEA